jgi:hypothetical protein
MGNIIKKIYIFFKNLFNNFFSFCLIPLKVWKLSSTFNVTVQTKTDLRLELYSILLLFNNSFLLFWILCAWTYYFLLYHKDIQMLDFFDFSFLWEFYENKIIPLYPYISFYYWLMLPITISTLFTCGYFIYNKHLFILNEKEKLFATVVSFRLFPLFWDNNDARTEKDIILKKPRYYFLKNMYKIYFYKLFVFSWLLISNILIWHKRGPIINFIWNIWYDFFKANLIFEEFMHFITLIFLIWLLCFHLLFFYIQLINFIKKLKKRINE